MSMFICLSAIRTRERLVLNLPDGNNFYNLHNYKNYPVFFQISFNLTSNYSTTLITRHSIIWRSAFFDDKFFILFICHLNNFTILRIIWSSCHRNNSGIYARTKRNLVLGKLCIMMRRWKEIALRKKTNSKRQTTITNFF